MSYIHAHSLHRLSRFIVRNPAQLVSQFGKGYVINLTRPGLPQNEVVMDQPAHGAAAQHKQLFSGGAGHGAEHHYWGAPVGFAGQSSMVWNIQFLYFAQNLSAALPSIATMR
jgi:hypothetical protein